MVSEKLVLVCTGVSYCGFIVPEDKIHSVLVGPGTTSLIW